MNDLHIILALMASGFLLGAVVAAPIFYALGSEHTARGMRDDFRTIRDARRRA